MTLAVREGDSDESGEFWILDSGSSRHLVNDTSWLEDVEDCADQCVQPSGDPLRITKKGSVTLQVTACGAVQTVKLPGVYYAKGVIHSLISHGQQDRKGFVLALRDGRRVVAARDSGQVAFDVKLRRNVLVVSGTVQGRLRPPAEVIMAALEEKATGSGRGLVE